MLFALLQSTTFFALLQLLTFVCIIAIASVFMEYCKCNLALITTTNTLLQWCIIKCTIVIDNFFMHCCKCLLSHALITNWNSDLYSCYHSLKCKVLQQNVLMSWNATAVTIFIHKQQQKLVAHRQTDWPTLWSTELMSQLKMQNMSTEWSDNLSCNNSNYIYTLPTA